MIRNLTTTSRPKNQQVTTTVTPTSTPNNNSRQLPVLFTLQQTNPVGKSSKIDNKSAKRNLEIIPDETVIDDMTNEKVSTITTTTITGGGGSSGSFSLGSVNSELQLQPLPDQTLEEPKLIEQAMSGIRPIEHYLNMSHDDYLQHKSPILQCRFSNDGKYVASVDSQGYIKSIACYKLSKIGLKLYFKF